MALNTLNKVCLALKAINISISRQIWQNWNPLVLLRPLVLMVTGAVMVILKGRGTRHPRTGPGQPPRWWWSRWTSSSRTSSTMRRRTSTSTSWWPWRSASRTRTLALSSSGPSQEQQRDSAHGSSTYSSSMRYLKRKPWHFFLFYVRLFYNKSKICLSLSNPRYNVMLPPKELPLRTLTSSFVMLKLDSRVS